MDQVYPHSRGNLYYAREALFTVKYHNRRCSATTLFSGRPSSLILSSCRHLQPILISLIVPAPVVKNSTNRKALQQGELQRALPGHVSTGGRVLQFFGTMVQPSRCHFSLVYACTRIQQPQKRAQVLNALPAKSSWRIMQRVYVHPTLGNVNKTSCRLLSPLFFLPHHFMSALNSTYLASIAGEDNQLVAGAFGVAAILATTAVYYAFGSKDKVHEFPKLRGIQLYHAWNFFQRRYEFLHSNFKRNLGKSFSFNVLHHNVVALVGEDARQAFFSNPHLDFDEGYKILMGAVRGPPTRQQNVLLIPMAIGTPDQRRGCSDRGERRRECYPPQQEVE